MTKTVKYEVKGIAIVIVDPEDGIVMFHKGASYGKHGTRSTRKEALALVKSHIVNPKTQRVVDCTITFTIPEKKAKK